MHSRLNAFLLLALISGTLIFTALPEDVMAQPSVKIGIRLWNYNVTHVVPDATVSILNGTRVEASGVTNLTGWVPGNLTTPNAGIFTLQVKLHNIIVYNGTLDVNSTLPFRNLTGINVADYSFYFSDDLSRPVENAQVDLRVNSSIIATSWSASNGSAVVRNLPFSGYNMTTSRQRVFISNSTVTINATTYSQTTALSVPTYDYSLTVMDHTGANIVQTGTVSVYDVGVSTHNATRTLTNPTQIQDLWPGRYWVIVRSNHDVAIWKSVETISSNYTQSVNANTGYSITLHVFDAIGRSVPSVKVDLILNGVIIGSQTTGAAGTVTFGNLPMSYYVLNLTLIGLSKTYATSANITGASLDFPVNLDDILLLGGIRVNTAPVVASLTLILTVAAALGTVWLYRQRSPTSAPTKDKEKGST